MLVLLSFILQMLLGSRNAPLRFCMRIAYLGADLVAVYALGFLSRHKDAHTETEIFWAAHPLAFLWAPFLLMHLSGQDTITAFAIEDNNLWLRHFLNLVVQIGLALCLLGVCRSQECVNSSSRHLCFYFWNYQVWREDTGSYVWGPKKHQQLQ